MTDTNVNKILFENKKAVGIAISYKNRHSKINFLKKKEYEKKLDKFLKKI